IDYQLGKMRLDAEIKKLLQKKEQEIVGILQKFKSRILKKNKAVAEYLGQQISTEEMELLKIDKSQNKANKVLNQMLMEKDTLLQLECSTHDYSTRELQASMNESKGEYHPGKCKLETKNLQKEIIRKNRTTHLIEKEGLMDIEMIEKKEISPIMANNQIKLEALQNAWALHYEEGKLCRVTLEKFNSDLLQERNIHKAILQNIPRTALESGLLRQFKYYKAKTVFIPNNRNGNPRSLVFVYFTESQNLNKAISQKYSINKEHSPEVEPPTGTGHSYIKEGNYTKRPILYPKRGRSLIKPELMRYNSSGAYNRQRNTKTYQDMSNTQQFSEREILEEILKRLSNLEEKQTGAPVQSKITKERSSQYKQSTIGQQNSKRHSTSPFQTSGQFLESCDNSAAINKKENAINTDFSSYTQATSNSHGRTEPAHQELTKFEQWKTYLKK
ncbi:14783_t:CDS:2, partial [Gigaspora margarita]